MEIRGSLRREFVETSSAKEAVLFSNTASFLLDRLRKDSSVSYVAHKLKTEEILDALKESSKNSPKDVLDLLWIYVFLVALSLKDDLEKFQDALNAIDLSQIQWGAEIRRAITENRTATNIFAIRYAEPAKTTETHTATNVAHGTVLGPHAKQ